MERTIHTRKIELSVAPVHVAPGGSVVYSISASAATMAALLRELREEIAFGLVDVHDLDDKDGVCVEIYFGAADEPDFSRVLAGHAQNIQESGRRDLPEGSELNGLSLSSRNGVIALLEGIAG